MTIYYTFTGTPIAGSRGVSSLVRTEYTAIQTAFTTVNAEMILKAPLASPTFTGTVTLPATTSIGNVSDAEISYLDGVTGPIQPQLDSKAPINSPTFTGTVTIPSGASIADYAPLASPALTGVPTAPTAAVGTNTTQIATMAALMAQAFLAALPAQPGGADTYKLNSITGVAAWALDRNPTGSTLYLANNYGAF